MAIGAGLAKDPASLGVQPALIDLVPLVRRGIPSADDARHVLDQMVGSKWEKRKNRLAFSTPAAQSIDTEDGITPLLASASRPWDFRFAIDVQSRKTRLSF